MLFEIAKKNLFFQNFVIKIMASIHPSIIHNVEKMNMIKKAMFHCELETIDGGYFEFGVFEGASMYNALLTHKKIKSTFKRNFYGFDSFDEGFKYFNEKDIHPFFKEGDFVSSYEMVRKRLKQFNNVKLTKGYFEDTVQGKKTEEICGTEKCAILFIDCDLMNPSLVALNFMQPILQEGSVIILDDYWAYKGKTEFGTCGALNIFLNNFPTIKIRQYNTYGCGGNSFIIEKI